MTGRPRTSLLRRLFCWAWARRLTAAAFLVLLFLGHRHALAWLVGSATATRLFGVVPLVDPLAGLEVMLASRTFPLTLLVGVSITGLAGALLGRVFCGWVCPLGLMLDLGDALGRRLRRPDRRGNVRPRRALPAELKYWLLALCTLLSVGGGVPVFTTFSPVNLTALAIVFLWGVELAALGLLVAIEFFARRAFCRSVCPLGAFYSLIGRFGRWRVRIDRNANCPANCRRCTRDCPMGIDVYAHHVLAGNKAIANPECTRCGDCATGCPGNVLRL